MQTWSQGMRKPKPPTSAWTWQNDWIQIDDVTFHNFTTGAKVKKNEGWSGRDPNRWYVENWFGFTEKSYAWSAADKTRTFYDPEDAKKLANEVSMHMMVERQIEAAYAKGWRDALSAVRSGVKVAAELIDPPTKKPSGK